MEHQRAFGLASQGVRAEITRQDIHAIETSGHLRFE